MKTRLISIVAVAALAAATTLQPVAARAQECASDAAAGQRGIAEVASAVDGASHHHSWWSGALHVTDDVMGAAALGVGVATVVVGGGPVLAVAGATVGAYFAARGAYDLYQRYEHHQSLDPLHSAQARGDDLGIVAGAFGVGAFASGARVIGGLETAKLLGVSGSIAGLATMPDATLGLIHSWHHLGNASRGMAVAQLGMVAVTLGHDGVADRALLAEESTALHASASDSTVAQATRLFGGMPHDVYAVDAGPSEAMPPTVRAFLGPDAKFLGQGWTAKAWGNDEWVVKVTKRTTKSGNLMPEEDPAKRQAMTVSSVQVMDALRNSPEFAPWAHVLPDTFSPGPNVVVQRRAVGLHYDDLPDGAKARANEQLDALRVAARRAAPGYEWDLNHGNELFDEQGNVTSWFDPAGGASWIPDWTPGKPIARNTWDAASALIHRRIDDSNWSPTSAKLPVGDTFAKKIVGPDLQWGNDAYVVANLHENRAFVIKNGFRYQWDGDRWLGAPTDEEHWEGDVVVQHFQHGFMTWNSQQGMQTHPAN